MTWESALSWLLLLVAFVVISGSTLFFLVFLAWRFFWKWLRDELLADWQMLDKPEKDDASCPCNCKRKP